MRASQFKKKQSLSRLFVSNKCTTAIPVACGLTRDMLIQASLDSSIRQIDYVSSVNIGGRNLRLDTVVISRDDGRFAIEIAEARPPRDIDDEDAFQTALRDIGVSYLAMTAADIRQEPRLSNCRDIWRLANATVPLDERREISAAIEESGGAITLGEIARRVETFMSAKSTVFALACDGSIDIAFSEMPLCSRTLVRTGFGGQRLSDFFVDNSRRVA